MKTTSIWTKEIIVETPTTIRFYIHQAGKKLSFKEVFTLWKISPEFRIFYQSILIDHFFPAIYWEHPALTTSFLDKAYECIILCSSSLDNRNLDASSFSTHFSTKDLVTNFLNLGKNAELVVPTPQGQIADYKHLASFFRSTKTTQQHQLLERIGTLMLKKIDNQAPIWLNTAGNGVIWLHVRLDSRPKYYKTTAYKNPLFLE